MLLLPAKSSFPSARGHSRVLQTTNQWNVYVEKEVSYKEWAFVITEADKSQDLQPAGWSPVRAAVSLLPVSSSGLQARPAGTRPSVEFDSEDRDKLMVQFKGRQEDFLLGEWSAFSIQALKRLDVAHPRVNLLFSVYEFKCYSHAERDTPENV